MNRRQVCSFLGCPMSTCLKDQAAAGLLDLDESAALGLVGEVALAHVLASPLLPDQTRKRRSDDEQALYGHAAGLSHGLVAGVRPAPNLGHNLERESKKRFRRPSTLRTKRSAPHRRGA